MSVKPVKLDLQVVVNAVNEIEVKEPLNGDTKNK